MPQPYDLSRFYRRLYFVSGPGTSTVLRDGLGPEAFFRLVKVTRVREVRVASLLNQVSPGTV